MDSGQTSKKSFDNSQPADDPISDEQAVQLARQASRGKLEIPENVTPIVERTQDHCIVTFPMKHPPGVRGADFYARVTINLQSGEVENILSGH